MFRLIILVLAAGIMAGGAAFAQGGPGVPDANLAAEAFYNKIDTTTEWGKWMVGVFKPYADKLTAEALVTIFPVTQIDPTGLSREELMKKVTAGYADYYNALQKITPPEELKAYHSKISELYVVISKNIPMTPEQSLDMEITIKKLYEEAMQEIVNVLKSRGVPPDVIEEFTETL